MGDRIFSATKKPDKKVIFVSGCFLGYRLLWAGSNIAVPEGLGM